MGGIKTVGYLVGLKLVAAVLGIVYAVLQVQYFGTTRVIEIYFAAQSVVYLITSLTQSGQLAEVFLPEYIQLKTIHTDKTAHQAYSVVVNRLSCYLIVLLGIGYIIAPFLIKVFIPGFSEFDQNQGSILFRAFLPLIFLRVQAAFLRTILNAERIFGQTEFAGLLNILISILLLSLFYDQLGIWTLLVSLYIGIFVELSLYLYYAIKKKIRYYPIWQLSHFEHRTFFKTILSTFSYTGGTQLYNWALTATISFMPQGTYAIFQYVQKLYPKVSGIISMPINTVFFTRVSELIAKKSKENLKKEVREILEYSLIIGTLIALIAFSAGQEGLAFLWKGDNFSSEDLNLAYLFLITFFFLFSIQVFYGINRKLSVALGFAKLNYQYQAISQIISAGVAFLVIPILGINGILLTLIINRVCLVAIPVYINKKKIQTDYQLPNTKFIFRILVVSFLILGGIYFIKPDISFLDNNTRLYNLYLTLFWSVSTLIIFITAAYFIQLKEVFGLTHRLKTAFLRKK